MAPKPHTPESMRIRAAVRSMFGGVGRGVAGRGSAADLPLVLVALSGGADSLALAAALAAEARAAGVRAGAVIVDHGLQAGSAEVAVRAAEQAHGLGLSPVVVRLVEIDGGRSSVTGGPEAAARSARYEALAAAARELGAAQVLAAHTRDDQAEQVLLALARGSGTRSLAGIPPTREIGEGILLVRPLLDEHFGITRATTEASCVELGLAPWRDPHNSDRSFARVRVREAVLPVLEDQLGPGVGAALARSADLAREDADALDAIAERHLASIVDSGPIVGEDRRVLMAVDGLLALPAALRGRVVRLVAAREFAAHLTREHTLAILSLVTAWRGQGPIDAPRIRVTREAATLVFRAR